MNEAQHKKSVSGADMDSTELMIETGPWIGMRKPLRANPPREILIGRDPERCYLVLHESHTSVSQKHAVFEHRPEGLFVRCLGQTGVRINERTVLAAGQEAVVGFGDRIWLGGQNGVRLVLREPAPLTLQETPTVVLLPRGAAPRVPENLTPLQAGPQTVAPRPSAPTMQELLEQLAQARRSYRELKGMYVRLEEENAALKQQPRQEPAAAEDKLDRGEALAWLERCRQQLQVARRALQGVERSEGADCRSALSGALDALVQLMCLFET